MTAQPCPFCESIDNGTAQWNAEHCVAFADGYPLTPGHTLVVPRRHERDLFALIQPERADIWTLVDTVRARLQQELNPDGYNIGVNIGTAGGQTVDHAHVHVIPRYSGDVEDPRGGVRWIIPERAPYWT